VVPRSADQPILAQSSMHGSATATSWGLRSSGRIALRFSGHLRVFTARGRQDHGRCALRALGPAVTVFQGGRGCGGAGWMSFTSPAAPDLKRILEIVNEEDSESFYITEMARDVRKAIRPTGNGLHGWRAVSKRK